MEDLFQGLSEHLADAERRLQGVIEDLRPDTIAPIVRAKVAKEAKLMTDEAYRFKKMGKEFVSHESVNHARNEYVRYATPLIITNTVEGYFSVFKRGMRGTYQHCAEKTSSPLSGGVRFPLQRACSQWRGRYAPRGEGGVKGEGQAAHRSRLGLNATQGRLHGINARIY